MKQQKSSFEDRINLYIKLSEEAYEIIKKNKYAESPEETSHADQMCDIWYTFDEVELKKFEEIMSTYPVYWTFRDTDKRIIRKYPIELFYEQKPVVFTKHLMKQYEGQKTYFGSKIMIDKPRLYIIITSHTEEKPKLVMATDADLKYIGKMKYIMYYKNIPVFEDNR